MSLGSDQVVTRGDARRAMQRHIVKAVIAAGASWPESAGAPVDLPPAFYWIRIDNSRSAAGNDLLISLDGPVKQSGDAFGFWDRVNGGEKRVRNIGKPGTDAPAKELHILNIGAGQATVWIELAMDPIIDIASSASGTSTQPTVVRIEDQSTTAQAQLYGDGDGTGTGGNQLLVQSRGQLYNGATWDRARSAGQGVAAVGDISVFTVETTVLLGASATFTGAMHDTLNFNWLGAKSNVSGGQAGTLFIDESSAASGANIYQVAQQAAAAEPATHGSPGTVANTSFGARVLPVKALLRYNRVVYVNGAAAQTGTFEVQSSQSPLN